MPGVTVFNDRGGAYDQGVYVCESKDMGGNLVKPELYNLNFEQLGAMQDTLIGRVSARMRALRTNGDGACGVHGLFGSPALSRTGEFELFASDARNVAAQHLGPSLDDLEQRVGVQDQVHAVDEFLGRFCRGPFPGSSDS